MSIRDAIIGANLSNLCIWARIRADDQKMMFCARQAAELIQVEHMAELSLAWSVLQSLPPADNPQEYAHLEGLFFAMAITTVRDISAFADANGIAQFDA